MRCHSGCCADRGHHRLSSPQAHVEVASPKSLHLCCYAGPLICNRLPLHALHRFNLSNGGWQQALLHHVNCAQVA